MSDDKKVSQSAGAVVARSVAEIEADMQTGGRLEHMDRLLKEHAAALTSQPSKSADVGGVELSADQIEDLMPENEGNKGAYPCMKCGWIKVSAQWLHDFARSVHRAALAAQTAAQGEAK